MEVKIIVDNYVLGHKGMFAEHGFSALVNIPEKEVTILFDTGTTGKVLINNIRASDIDPKKVNIVVISHRHYDHTGGLKAFLETREGIETLIVSHPDLFEPAFAKGTNESIRYIGNPFRREELEALGARFAFTKRPIKIADGVTVTGEIPREWGPSHTAHMLRQGEEGLIEDSIPDDTALILETPEGLVIITGCGHAGIENIIEYSISITGEKRLAAVIGGLHLMGATEERIKKVTEYLASKSPAAVAATHCTGLRAQAALASALGKRFIVAGVGKVIEFE